MPGRLSAFARSLSARVLVALVLGLAVGAAIQSQGTPAAGLVAGVEAIGGLWLSALQMTVVPLVFSALIVGVAQASDAAATGRLAARAIVLFIVLVTLAAALTVAGVLAALNLNPVDPVSAAALIDGVSPGSGAALAPPPESTGFAGWLASLAPQNPVRAAADSAILPLVLFALAFGFAITRLPDSQRLMLGGFFDAVADAMIVIVRWVLWAAPVGVFALAMALGLKGGLASAGALFHYIVLVSGACIVTVLFSYPLATIAGRVPLSRFARAMVPVQAVAFSTQSSLGTLPVMLERARDFLGIPERIGGLILPMAVAIFRITSPVANLAVALFIAHIYGLQPGMEQIIAAILVSVAVSIGAVGLPGQVSFFASMAPICLALGVPLDILPLLLAVEVIPDIFRTLGNVSADMAVTTALSRGQTEISSSAGSPS